MARLIRIRFHTELLRRFVCFCLVFLAVNLHNAAICPKAGRIPRSRNTRRTDGRTFFSFSSAGFTTTTDTRGHSCALHVPALTRRPLLERPCQDASRGEEEGRNETDIIYLRIRTGEFYYDYGDWHVHLLHQSRNHRTENVRFEESSKLIITQRCGCGPSPL